MALPFIPPPLLLYPKPNFLTLYTEDLSFRLRFHSLSASPFPILRAPSAIDLDGKFYPPPNYRPIRAPAIPPTPNLKQAIILAPRPQICIVKMGIHITTSVNRGVATTAATESQMVWHHAALLLSSGHPTRLVKLVSQCALFSASPELIEFLCSIPDSPISLTSDLYHPRSNTALLNRNACLCVYYKKKKDQTAEGSS